MSVPTTVDGLRLRAILGRKDWHAPRRYGPDGWQILRVDGKGDVIVSACEIYGARWIHASVAHYDATMPEYAELTQLHKAVFGTGWAYQVFAPPSSHVNIHEYALHLWGRADGAAVLPDFGAGGSI